MLNPDETNKIAWDKQVRAHQLLFPDERIVTFLAKNYPDTNHNNQLTALDIGCGSGRHLQLLLDYGFQTYGIDYAAAAIEVAHRQVGHHPRLGGLIQADLCAKSFASVLFDVIVLWGNSFFRPCSEIQRDLSIIHDLMKANGRLILNFRTKENWFYGKGQPLDGGTTFRLDKTAGPYADMCYTFLDFDQAAKLLTQAGFAVENSERLDLWKKHATEHHSWWIFWARKQ